MPPLQRLRRTTSPTLGSTKLSRAYSALLILQRDGRTVEMSTFKLFCVTCRKGLYAPVALDHYGPDLLALFIRAHHGHELQKQEPYQPTADSSAEQRHCPCDHAGSGDGHDGCDGCETSSDTNEQESDAGEMHESSLISVDSEGRDNT